MSYLKATYMYICTCIHTCTHTYIHPPNVPRVQHSLVSTAHLAIIFHVSLSCAFLFRLYISLLHHSFISSCHSLFGLPLFVFPSISLNTTSFISLLSSILQMCPSNVCIHTYIHTYIHKYMSAVKTLALRHMPWPLKKRQRNRTIKLR